ncbi:hypothetical protein D9M71_650450 [compost metagenome]
MLGGTSLPWYSWRYMSRSTVESAGPMTLRILSSNGVQVAGEDVPSSALTLHDKVCRSCSSFCNGSVPRWLCLSQNKMVRADGCALSSISVGGSKGLATKIS